MANINSSTKSSGGGRLAIYIICAMILGILFGWSIPPELT